MYQQKCKKWFVVGGLVVAGFVVGGCSLFGSDGTADQPALPPAQVITTTPMGELEMGTAAAIETTQQAQGQGIVPASTPTGVAPQATPTPFPTVTPTPTVTPSAVVFLDQTGAFRVTDEMLVFLESLKESGFPVDQWNQYAEGGTRFDQAEITAGDNRQNWVSINLWPCDRSVPWGEGEFHSLIHRGESITLADGFCGTGWTYSITAAGQGGWTLEYVSYDTVAALWRRTQSTTIAEVAMYQIAGGCQLVALDDAEVYWAGTCPPEITWLEGVRGYVPLNALLDLNLVEYRHQPLPTPTLTGS